MLTGSKDYCNQQEDLLNVDSDNDQGVIPYQFTKVLHMTPSELGEIWCKGSLGGHMFPKGISAPLLVWLPRNDLSNNLLFCFFAIPVTIQSIIA